MVDVRTEHSLINKHVRQHNREAGETIMWYQFVPLAASASAGSVWDDVYDEGVAGAGGRTYSPGIVIPTVYIEEREDQFTLQEDGRHTVMTIYAVILYEDAKVAGLTLTKEYEHHLNDIFFYDGKHFKINDYHVRGRIPGEVVIGILGYEVYLDQEFVFDPGPIAYSLAELPWPDTFAGV